MLGRIKKVIVHGIGNKVFSEGLKLSKDEAFISDTTTGVLLSTIEKAKFSGASFQFYHESGELEMNNMYVYSNRLFNSDTPFVETSCKIARSLYECSEHPKIRHGELLIVLFEDCAFRGKKCNALGLFKLESRGVFFDFKYKNGSYSILEQEGLNVDSLEKGAIIYDIEAQNGYCISLLMRADLHLNAKYWMNDFLHITQSSDSFYKTQQIISLTRNYVKEVLSEHDTISRVEQSEIIARAADYFTTKEVFEDKSFCRAVFREKETIDAFHAYGSKEALDVNNLFDTFEIDRSMVKKQSRLLRSIIKLDKNFHIYIHGGEGMIKKGYDDVTGLEFYQLYFKKEE